MRNFDTTKSLFGNHRAATILHHLRAYQSKGLSLVASSSFQTQSVPLLHILSTLDEPVPIIFINTGYLFPETLIFRDQIVDSLGLQLIEVRPSISKSEQRDAEGRLLYVNHPSRCCELNKVEPMGRVLAGFDVWISGVRSDQTTARRLLKLEQPGPSGVTRYHPMLDWSAEDIEHYRITEDLPAHPFAARGIVSVGCEPCTTMTIDACAGHRSSRWRGRAKTECGLHTELAQADGESNR